MRVFIMFSGIKTETSNNIYTLSQYSTLANMKLLCCMFICAASLLPGCAAAEVRLELRLYDPLDTLDPLLVCNDGSPGGYYYREATTQEDGDKWIFYLEGGGWCWNQTSCVRRCCSVAPSCVLPVCAQAGGS